MTNAPIRLYDLGNTLLAMGHADYVFGQKPQLKAVYEQGDIEANYEYESILEEGLRRGQVRLTVGADVERKLASDVERGMKNAVFSTCLAGAVEAALEQTGLRPYVSKICSSFGYNAPTLDAAKHTASMKTVGGFRAVYAALGDSSIVSYADDKLVELRRAHDGLGDAVALYKIGGEALSNQDGRIIVVKTIADIPDAPWRRAALGRARPRPV